MKFNEFPFLRYFIFIGLGIFFYPKIGLMNSSSLIWGIGFLLIVYLGFGLSILGDKGFRLRWLFPFLAYLLLFLTGYFFAYQSDDRNDRQHLSHFNKVEAYMAVVLDLDQEKANSFANRLEVKKVKTADGYFEANGEVAIYHQLDSRLQIGEVLWVKGSPEAIKPPANPAEFDYRRFLANRQVYHSHFVGKNLEVLGKVNERPIYSWVSGIRIKAILAIDKLMDDKQAAQVLKAFLLGEKQDLDQELNDAYIKAGTMHILAVSGLHVGMIYGFFFLFFKPTQSALKKRLVLLTIIVLLIWGYALLTGLSPSVKRAASMFTLLSLAQVISRSPSIINSLALSAVILAVLQPFIIYEVGFQLSYAAVFGIVLLQPLIRRLWLPRNKLLYYLWEISSVSIAAQLATFPISAYYFHVFPNYGLLANLWAIPGAFLIMALGLPFLLLLIVGVSIPFWASLLETVVKVLNYLIFSVQELPFAQTEGIYLGLLGMLLFWLGLSCLAFLYEYRKKRYAFLLLGICLMGIVSHHLNWFGQIQKEELYVYNLRKGWALDYFSEGKLYTFDLDLPENEQFYKVIPHRKSLEALSVHRLISQKTKEGRIVYLPNGKELLLNKSHLNLRGLSISELAFFDQGSWKIRDNEGLLPLGGMAYKIILDSGN